MNIKKKISTIFATVVSISCLACSVPASAESWKDFWEFGDSDKSIDDGFVVLGTSIDPLGNLAYAVSTGGNTSFGVIRASELEPYLENADMLTVGDIIYVPRTRLHVNGEIEPTFVGILNDEEYEFEMNHNPFFPYRELVDEGAKVEYLGNGIELYGEEFRDSMVLHVNFFKDDTDEEIEEWLAKHFSGMRTWGIDITSLCKAYRSNLTYEECNWTRDEERGYYMIKDGIKFYMPELTEEEIDELGKRQYHQQYEPIDINITIGDATADTSVDILDVIVVNKQILGKESLSGYGKAFADVNADGEIDTNDALTIMKYVVGLTDNLNA